MMIRLKHLSGKSAHLAQRYSALYLVIAFPILFFAAAFQSWPDSIESLQGLIGYNLLTLVVWGTLVTTLIHMWVGGREMIIDYIPRKWTDAALTMYFYALIVATIHIHLMLMI